MKNGSFTQGPEYEGLSHLYEHMFFKANAAYPNPDEFVARASELGAEFNGTTSEERVNYYLTLPADSIEGGMKFLAAALVTPLFRQDELERERRWSSESTTATSRARFSVHDGDGPGALDDRLEPQEPARRARGHSEHDAGRRCARFNSATTSRTTRRSSSPATSPRTRRSRWRARTSATGSAAPIRSRPIRFRRSRRSRTTRR